jgi:VanZ family protein
MMGIIFVLSHQSGDSIQLPLIPGLDKIGHAGLYGLLAATVLWHYAPRWTPTPPPAPSLPVATALKTIAFCFLYGISDEIHQHFVPHRSVSVLDLLADLTGALTVSSVWLLMQRCHRKMIDTTREIQ